MGKETSSSQENNSNTKRLIGRILNIIVTIILVLTLVVLVAAVISAVQNKDNMQEAYVFGYKPVVIVTGSMEETIKKRAIVIVEKLEEDDIEELEAETDVIVYEREGIFITHRLIDSYDDPETGEKKYQTKGDNNNKQDPYTLSKDDIKAKVVLVFNLFGHLYSRTHNSNDEIVWSGMFIWVFLPIILLVIAYIAFKTIRKYLSKNKEENQDADVDGVGTSPKPAFAGAQPNENDSVDSDNSASILKAYDRVIVVLAIVTGIILIVSILFAVIYQNNPDNAFIFGHKPMFVKEEFEGGYLKENGLVIVKEVKTSSDLDVGDIVVYLPNDEADVKDFKRVEVVFSDDSLKLQDFEENVGMQDINAKVVSVMNWVSELSTLRGLLLFVLLPLVLVAALLFLIRYIVKNRNKASLKENEDLYEEPKMNVADAASYNSVLEPDLGLAEDDTEYLDYNPLIKNRHSNRSQRYRLDNNDYNEEKFEKFDTARENNMEDNFDYFNEYNYSGSDQLSTGANRRNIEEKLDKYDEFEINEFDNGMDNFINANKDLADNNVNFDDQDFSVQPRSFSRDAYDYDDGANDSRYAPDDFYSDSEFEISDNAYDSYFSSDNDANYADNYQRANYDYEEYSESDFDDFDFSDLDMDDFNEIDDDLDDFEFDDFEFDDDNFDDIY